MYHYSTRQRVSEKEKQSTESSTSPSSFLSLHRILPLIQHRVKVEPGVYPRVSNLSQSTNTHTIANLEMEEISKHGWNMSHTCRAITGIEPQPQGCELNRLNTGLKTSTSVDFYYAFKSFILFFSQHFLFPVFFLFKNKGLCFEVVV